MALNDAQIERYSRQIIVPRVGGRAQERLLTSRLLLIGAPDDVDAPLAYLAGAGVGTIHLLLTPHPETGIPDFAARMRGLNPDVAVELSWNRGEPPDFVFAILGTQAALDAARMLWLEACPGPAVVARLDAPERIAVLGEPPPCPRCGGADLFAPMGRRSENARIVSMAATTEAFKALAGYESGAPPYLIEFEGLSACSRALSPGPESMHCGCNRVERGIT